MIIFIYGNKTKKIFKVTGRLEDFLQLKKVSFYRLENDLRVGRGSISRAVSGGKNMGSNVVEKILNYFPDLSAEWLLRGNGDPIKKDKELTTNDKEVSDEWLIKQTLLHLKIKDKAHLIDFFKQFNEKNDKLTFDKMVLRMEKLDMTLAQLVLDMELIKEGKKPL
jgi:hypothetical protein